MRKRMLRRGLLMYALVALFLSMSCISVHAERNDVDSIIYIEGNNAIISRICAIGNDQAGVEILVYTAGDGLLSFSNKRYSSLTVGEKNLFMEKVLKTVTDSGLSTKSKNKTFNFIADQDSSLTASLEYLRDNANTDFATASAWFRPFGSFFGVVLGIICIVLFISLGLSILLDWTYLVVDPIRLLLTRGDASKKPFGVSREAYASAKEVEQQQEYVGVAGLYLKRRIPLIIVMSVCMGYLISGKVYDILIWFIDAFMQG